MAHIMHHFVSSYARDGILSRGMFFHQDNVPVHKSVIALAAINDNEFELRSI